jgi:hypothetical protein
MMAPGLPVIDLHSMPAKSFMVVGGARVVIGFTVVGVRAVSGTTETEREPSDPLSRDVLAALPQPAASPAAATVTAIFLPALQRSAPVSEPTTARS